MSQRNSSSQFPQGVSERDRRIYRQVVIEHRTQRDVADEHQISQARVSHIVQRVFRWLSQVIPERLEATPLPERQQAVARAYREKLEYCEAEALAAYEQSKRQETVVTTFIMNGAGDHPPKVRRRVRFSRRNSQGDVRYLQAAQRFARLLAEFEGFASVRDDGSDRAADPLSLGTIEGLGESGFRTVNHRAK